MENDQLQSLSRNLAQNMASLRGAKNLSQTDLAKKAEIPRSTITNLETGDGNPSLHNLARIAKALRVSLAELISEPRAECYLLKKDSLAAKASDRGNVTVYSLLPDPIPGFELERLEIKTSGWRAGTPHLAGTKEYLYGLQGEITVYVAGDRFVVGPGDTLAFPGDQAHSYRNHGGDDAAAVSVVAMVPHKRKR